MKIHQRKKKHTHTEENSFNLHKTEERLTDIECKQQKKWFNEKPWKKLKKKFRAR